MAHTAAYVLVWSLLSVTWGSPDRDATVRVWRGVEQCAHTIVIPKTDPEVCPGGRDTVVFLQDLKDTVDDLIRRMKNVETTLESLETWVKDDQLKVYSTLTKVLLQEQENSKQVQVFRDEIRSLKRSPSIPGNTSTSKPDTDVHTTPDPDVHPSPDVTEEESKEATEIRVTRDSWTEYDFEYEDNWNACHGRLYVKLTGYAVGKYVGVVLCSAKRYKIFLSQELGDMFRNVADSSGHGKDHCEFLGLQTDATKLDSDFWNSPSTEGYCRSFRGERLEYGRIGGPPQTDEWTGCYYPHWYECGISIP